MGIAPTESRLTIHVYIVYHFHMMPIGINYGAFMNQLTLLALILTVIGSSSSFSAERKINLGDFVWARTLKQQKIDKINICGNADILVTSRSISKDFLIGEPKKGYLFSDLVAYDDYWKILESLSLEKAKTELTNEFKRTVLWQVSESGKVVKIGSPSRVTFAMTSTVKDCMEGAKTTLGNDCSNRKNRSSCCKEKFVGPNIYWANDQGEFRLSYSPDPSVRLRVPTEIKHRFCHSIDSIVL